MATRKKPDFNDEDTEIPELPPAPSGELVRIAITRFGGGKVSTGVHIGGAGDVTAKRGEVIETSVETARALQDAGFAEIVA